VLSIAGEIFTKSHEIVTSLKYYFSGLEHAGKEILFTVKENYASCTSNMKALCLVGFFCFWSKHILYKGIQLQPTYWKT
jgi:hypothetical protein